MCIVRLLGRYVMVYWTDEDSVSVVDEDRVDEVRDIGEMCDVKCGKSIYNGKIAAIGKE